MSWLTLHHQWTIAARPHHPVFLDVISYALKMAEAQRLGIAEQKRVLDMTGPGSWVRIPFHKRRPHLLIYERISD